MVYDKQLAASVTSAKFTAIRQINHAIRNSSVLVPKQKAGQFIKINIRPLNIHFVQPSQQNISILRLFLCPISKYSTSLYSFQSKFENA
jgi:hypothetical protein